MINVNDLNDPIYGSGLTPYTYDSRHQLPDPEPVRGRRVLVTVIRERIGYFLAWNGNHTEMIVEFENGTVESVKFYDLKFVDLEVPEEK